MTVLPAGPLDSLGMFSLAASTPELAADAVAATHDALEEIEPISLTSVVIAGAGADGLAGDVIAAVTSVLSPVPVSVLRSYECPAHVGADTLFLAVSTSGDSEETVEAATAAEAAGAAMVAVTGGGQLATLAESWGAPIIPAGTGISVSRAALAATSVASLTLLDHLGLYPGGKAWVAAAIEQLKTRRDAIEAAGDASLPATIARRIGRTMPLLHGASPIGAAAARRWKAQVNLNAKTPAWCAAQPDLLHDEVSGWGQGGDVTRQVLTLVALRHEAEHPQVGRRFEQVAEMMREVVADVVEVEAAGDGDLAQLLDLILIGDYVSLWMAVAAGVDPGPVPVLDELGDIV